VLFKLFVAEEPSRHGCIAMEPYETVNQLYCYNRIAVWWRVVAYDVWWHYNVVAPASLSRPTMFLSIKAFTRQFLT